MQSTHKKDSGQSVNALAVLTVIDRLEIGPVRLQKRKAVSQYTVIQSGRTDTFDLAYSFEEDVFDPNDPSSQNLAAMILSQVALNYGLFCQEIIFHGVFDALDRKFITEMTENTSREIFVMKFLHENPFLTDAVASFAVVKLPRYTQAKITFDDPVQKGRMPATKWPTQSGKHAILSSGGKDSLLSFALLQEMGFAADALFVNESGRHWFTALNAYRHFKVAHAGTARVWTNSDRLFSWMLRHLPFIRKDFARLRADEYPIRLWTVAVFLFGALPIMRKRAMGRLIIGDEYDTTVKSSFRGITHYNGLFDQSRYFDNLLTRYFMRKGWGISQFSMLRQCSELLIQSILARRYPEYQKHQLSCHAAHIQGERIYPCGKCEKCRRIASMLVAMDADPIPCGYSLAQVKDCLQALAEKGLHQESAGVQHLAFLLKEKGLLPRGYRHVQRSKPHLEIMKLRFHPEHSPANGLPADLRKPLFEILAQHAQGSVARHGGVWVNFNPLESDIRVKPYPYETTNGLLGRRENKTDHNEAKRTYILGELTWPEAQKRFKEVDIALLPVGAIEQHGPHLPLDTDAFDAEYLAEEVAAACSNPQPLVLPLIPYGVSYHHEDFSGTLSVTNETLSRFVYEIGMSAARNGITKLIIINGHGGNASTLQFAAQMINRDAHIFTCVDTGETSDADIDKIVETPNDVHAGEIETSTSLALRPQLVEMSKAPKSIPEFSSRYLNFSSRRSVNWNARTAKISSSGVLGDATKASAEKGKQFWKIMVQNLTEFVEQLKGMSLDEIHQKRY